MCRSKILNILQQRRSIRQFEKRSVEADKVDVLLESLLRVPSSRGKYPWEFIVVTEPELLAQLGRAKEHGSAFLAEAPLAIVIAADPDKCDVWVEDCAIAAITCQLAAEELGLGSCWVQIRLRSHKRKISAEDFIVDLLGLPRSYAVECVIGLGYPAEEKNGHAAETLLYDRIHREKF